MQWGFELWKNPKSVLGFEMALENQTRSFVFSGFIFGSAIWVGIELKACFQLRHNI